MSIIPGLDIHSLITQGQFSKNPNTLPTTGDGFQIFIEESIIDVKVPKRGGGGGIGGYTIEKKKVIYLKVKTHDDKIFQKEIILDNINLSVSNVREEEKVIHLKVRDVVTGEENTIRVNINI